MRYFNPTSEEILIFLIVPFMKDGKDNHNDDFHHPKVDHMTITPNMSVSSLVTSMSKSGVFNAGRLADACMLYREMCDQDAYVIMGLAGAMVPGGLRKAIADFIRHGYVHCLVSTGANITHDLVEAFGGAHMRQVPFKDDEELREKGIDRIYDAFLSDSGFIKLEEAIRPLLHKYIEKRLNEPDTDREKKVSVGTYELLKEIGSSIEDPNSIVKVASDYNVPIFVPALSDSVLGLNLWIESQVLPFYLDPLKDLGHIQSLSQDAGLGGAFLIGGGVPKNYVLQSRLISSSTFDYAIQITMDRVETGGLSGASLSETISWGKTSGNSKFATVISDATIAVPMILAYLRSTENN